MTRVFLAASGLLVVGLGFLILLAPVDFYASYGLAVGGQPSLLNELRSHGLWLAATGSFIAAGAVVPSLTRPALIVSAGAYLSYAAARLIAMAFDGVPASGMLLAMAAEGIIGLVALLLYLTARRRRPLVA